MSDEEQHTDGVVAGAPNNWPPGVAMQPGVDVPFLQLAQTAVLDHNRITLPYVPPNLGMHPTLPMGAFLTPSPLCSPLGHFYPAPSLPYPFVLPVIASAPPPAPACEAGSRNDALSSGSYRNPASSPPAVEDEDSDTESATIELVTATLPATCDLPWRAAGGGRMAQAPTLSFASDPSSSAPSTPIASGVQGRDKQPLSSLEELLGGDRASDSERRDPASTTPFLFAEVKPSSPPLVHFYQLLSRCKMAIQVRNLTTEGEVLSWLEITRKSCHIDPSLGPVNVARILVSSNGLCKLQLLYPYFKTVSTRLVPADEEGAELLLGDLGPKHVLCPGLPDYEKKYDIIGYHVPHVRVMNTGQLKRYDHDNCLLWYVPANLFTPSGHHLHNMCQHCKYLENKLTKLCSSEDNSPAQCDARKGAGRGMATPPYDKQQRAPKRTRRQSANADARRPEAGSKCFN